MDIDVNAVDNCRYDEPKNLHPVRSRNIYVGMVLISHWTYNEHMASKSNDDGDLFSDLVNYVNDPPVSEAGEYFSYDPFGKVDITERGIDVDTIETVNFAGDPTTPINSVRSKYDPKDHGYPLCDEGFKFDNSIADSLNEIANSLSVELDHSVGTNSFNNTNVLEPQSIADKHQRSIYSLNIEGLINGRMSMPNIEASPKNYSESASKITEIKNVPQNIEKIEEQSLSPVQTVEISSRDCEVEVEENNFTSQLEHQIKPETNSSLNEDEKVVVQRWINDFHFLISNLSPALPQTQRIRLYDFEARLSQLLNQKDDQTIDQSTEIGFNLFQKLSASMESLGYRASIQTHNLQLDGAFERRESKAIGKVQALCERFQLITKVKNPTQDGNLEVLRIFNEIDHIVCECLESKVSRNDSTVERKTVDFEVARGIVKNSIDRLVSIKNSPDSRIEQNLSANKADMKLNDKINEDQLSCDQGNFNQRGGIVGRLNIPQFFRNAIEATIRGRLCGGGDMGSSQEIFPQHDVTSKISSTSDNEWHTMQHNTSFLQHHSNDISLNETIRENSPILRKSKSSIDWPVLEEYNSQRIPSIDDDSLAPIIDDLAKSLMRSPIDQKFLDKDLFGDAQDCNNKKDQSHPQRLAISPNLCEVFESEDEGLDKLTELIQMSTRFNNLRVEIANGKNSYTNELSTKSDNIESSNVVHQDLIYDQSILESEKIDECTSFTDDNGPKTQTSILNDDKFSTIVSSRNENFDDGSFFADDEKIDLISTLEQFRFESFESDKEDLKQTNVVIKESTSAFHNSSPAKINQNIEKFATKILTESKEIIHSVLPGDLRKLMLVNYEVCMRTRSGLRTSIPLTSAEFCRLAEDFIEGEIDFNSPSADPKRLYLVPLNEATYKRWVTPDCRFLIGRKSTWLRAKSMVVSRRHAEIQFDENTGNYCISDRGSSSGTYLNGVRLSPPAELSESRPLHGGDIIQIGVDYKVNHLLSPNVISSNFDSKLDLRFGALQVLVLLGHPLKQTVSSLADVSDFLYNVSKEPEQASHDNFKIFEQHHKLKNEENFPQDFNDDLYESGRHGTCEPSIRLRNSSSHISISSAKSKNTIFSTVGSIKSNYPHSQANKNSKSRIGKFLKGLIGISSRNNPSAVSASTICTSQKLSSSPRSQNMTMASLKSTNFREEMMIDPNIEHLFLMTLQNSTILEGGLNHRIYCEEGNALFLASLYLGEYIGEIGSKNISRCRKKVSPRYTATYNTAIKTAWRARMIDLVDDTLEFTMEIVPHSTDAYDIWCLRRDGLITDKVAGARLTVISKTRIVIAPLMIASLRGDNMKCLSKQQVIYTITRDPVTKMVTFVARVANPEKVGTQSSCFLGEGMALLPKVSRSSIKPAVAMFDSRLAFVHGSQDQEDEEKMSPFAEPIMLMSTLFAISRVFV